MAYKRAKKSYFAEKKTAPQGVGKNILRTDCLSRDLHGNTQNYYGVLFIDIFMFLPLKQF